MEMHVTFRHMDPSETIKQHVQSRLDHLKKYLLKPGNAHVILGLEKFRRIAEITLTDNGDQITALDETDDMYKSIDGAIAKLEKQLRKHKEKIQSHKKSNKAP